MTDDYVLAYANEIRKSPLLKREEERWLIRKIQRGLSAAKKLKHAVKAKKQNTKGRKSKQRRRKLASKIIKGKLAGKRIIFSNLRLAKKAIRLYAPGAAPQEKVALIQECIKGLMRAVSKFDLKRGTKFSTYAMIWMRNFISRSPKEESFLSLDKNVGENGKSLHATIEDKKSLCPRRQAEISLIQEGVIEALQSLDEEERLVICLRFGLMGESILEPKEISEKLNISPNRVRAIISRAIRKLGMHESILKLDEVI